MYTLRVDRTEEQSPIGEIIEPTGITIAVPAWARDGRSVIRPPPGLTFAVCAHVDAGVPATHEDVSPLDHVSLYPFPTPRIEPFLREAAEETRANLLFQPWIIFTPSVNHVSSDPVYEIRAIADMLPRTRIFVPRVSGRPLDREFKWRHAGDAGDEHGAVLLLQ